MNNNRLRMLILQMIHTRLSSTPGKGCVRHDPHVSERKRSQLSGWGKLRQVLKGIAKQLRVGGKGISKDCYEDDNGKFHTLSIPAVTADGPGSADPEQGS